MKNWTTIAASSLVAIVLFAPSKASAQRHAPEGSSGGGTAGPRDGGGDSGSPAAPSGGGVQSVPAPSRSTMPDGSDRGNARTATGRERGDRPQVGTAAARSRPLLPDNSYQYSTRPYPYWWYSAYTPGFGLASYNLWSWGYRPDLWYSPYGYSPFGYSPFGYRPYGYDYGSGYGYGYGYGGSSSRDYDEDDDQPTGSIRLRVNPRNAKVYVDGALVGVVDDFDGLTKHLDLDPGPHQLELRAPGYFSYVTDVSVVDGKTITTRVTMKKNK